MGRARQYMHCGGSDNENKILVKQDRKRVYQNVNDSGKVGVKAQRRKCHEE